MKRRSARPTAPRRAFVRVAADPAVHCPRGVPVAQDGRVPQALLDRLHSAFQCKQTATDLALYGVVPRAEARAHEQ